VQLARGVQTIHAWHREVENDEVRAQLRSVFEGIQPVKGFASNLKARSFQQGADSGANGGVIVNNEDAVWHAALGTAG
jgi:hypothetical protein